MLPGFEIHNFRAFSHLCLPRLGKVNLIVGKNNVGKTTLLEALRVYNAASLGMPNLIEALRSVLLSRDELIESTSTAEHATLVSSLFRGRSLKRAMADPLIMSIVGRSDSNLSIKPAMVRRVEYDEVDPRGRVVWQVITDMTTAEVDPSAQVGLAVQFGDHRQTLPASLLTGRPVPRRRYPEPACLLAGGVDDATVSDWWSRVSLREGEQRIVEALNMIAPVDRISLVEHPVRRRDQMVLVRMRGEKEPVPLKSLGDGVVRMFHIALAFEYAGALEYTRQPTLFDVAPSTTDLMLIDEIENGIHYSVFPDLWRFVFRLATLHNLQVFATSHSWNCIEGFQIAAEEDQANEGMLIRLEAKRDMIRAVLFGEDELSIVTREEIEVR